jgi:HEAT repeat protein
VVAVVALVVGACGGGSEEMDPGTYQSGLQRQRIEELAKQGVPAVQPLLKSPRREVRLNAIGALGSMKGNAEATRLLLDLAKSSDEQDAYFALIGLARQQAAEAKGLIAGAFQSPNPRLREAACIAVAELGDKSLYPLVLKALNDPDPSVIMAAKGTMRRCKIEESAGQ